MYLWVSALSGSQADIDAAKQDDPYCHFVGSLSIEKWAYNDILIGQTFTALSSLVYLGKPMKSKHFG